MDLNEKIAGFEAAIKSGDPRQQLTALRDLVANELNVHRCDRCSALQLRTGDTAALALRLQKIIEDIAALPAEAGEEETELERLRRIKATRTSAPSDKPPPTRDWHAGS